MQRVIVRVFLMILIVGSLFAIYRLLTIKPRPYKTFLQGQHPVIFAHQGGAGLAPGNTLAAFKNAERLGADALELDVHSTSDGQIVVIHDNTVDGTTNGTGRVQDFALADLKKLDAGFDFTSDGGKTFPYRDKGVTIPTLEEVFQSFPTMRINIEIKQSSPPIEKPLADLIDRFNARDRVLVVSFDDEVINRFRALEPTVATGASANEVRNFFIAQQLRISSFYRPTADALQVPETQDGVQLITPHFVSAAQAREVAVHVWVVNDAESMKRLLNLGVDGIMTDRPDIALELLGRKSN